MAHRNARLTPVTRWELVQDVTAGWPPAEVARQFRVSRATVHKWVRRFSAEGRAGLEDRSSRPHQHPHRTTPALARRICALRRRRGFGPHRIGWTLGVARSTVYAVLRRAGLNRLDQLHRVTREPVLRYEHPRPGDLLHIDVKKLGRIPPGGGKRFAAGFAETQSGPHSRRSAGIDYLHVAVDDHSRYAYVEALPNERGVSCAAFLERAAADFAQRSVVVQRVLTDNAKAYRSHVFTAAAAARGIKLKYTQPYRPQTNGKAERFIQTLQREWAYARRYHSNAQRLRALTNWLNDYNQQRPHGGIGGAVPTSRL
jgi:transposase InsO family protein